MLTKKLKSLPKSAVVGISSKIDSLSENPSPSSGKKLKGEDLWKVRVGDYRIVYFVEDVVRIVEVVRISHRKDVYKKIVTETPYGVRFVISAQ